MLRAISSNVPLVQQGPLPVFFVTGLAALDLTTEYVAMIFCVDRSWGGDAIAERELTHQLIVPRTAFELIRAQLAAKMGMPIPVPASH